MKGILLDDAVTLLTELRNKFENTAPPSRSSSRPAIEERLEALRVDIERWLKAGHSATAIAKQLAPKGTKPTWETVRRVMIRKFGLTPRKRGKRGKKSVGNGSGNTVANLNHDSNANLQSNVSSAPVTPTASEQKRQPQPQRSSKPGDWSAALEMP